MANGYVLLLTADVCRQQVLRQFIERIAKIVVFIPQVEVFPLYLRHNCSLVVVVLGFVVFFCCSFMTIDRAGIEQRGSMSISRSRESMVHGIAMSRRDDRRGCGAHPISFQPLSY